MGLHLRRTTTQPSAGGDQAAAEHAFGAFSYLLVVICLFLLSPSEVFDIGGPHFILIIGFIGTWRYGWAALHLLRALYYLHWRFPALRRQAEALPRIDGAAPEVFFLLTSYRENPAVSAAMLRSLARAADAYGGRVTIVASVTDRAEQALAEDILCPRAAAGRIRLVTMIQDGTGKRSALADGLRAIARRLPGPRAIVVLMDGDTFAEPDLLRRSLPFFQLMPDLGGVTTDAHAVVTGSRWGRSWYELRYAQRHLLMSSMSVSRKLLVLTGRLSMIRADIVTRPDFIAIVEKDGLSHWRYGRFTFLTGDDKSTWFWLLRNRWSMLYLPDVRIRSREHFPTGAFLPQSAHLMARWFGNMLRSNGRALALGPRRVGFFVWWCLLDQRLSMWTSLTGPAFALLWAMLVTPRILAVYLLWVALTRLFHAGLIGMLRGSFSFRSPVLLYYTQVVGSIIKVLASFRLNRQHWTRQNVAQPRVHSADLHRAWDAYVSGLAIGVFLLTLATAGSLLELPDRQMLPHAFALIAQAGAGSPPDAHRPPTASLE